MKNFNKILFFIFMFATCFFNIFSIDNKYLISNAYDSNVVNFYDYKNENIIYSVDVPENYSLNDLENENIVTKSFWTSGDVIVSSPAVIGSWNLNSTANYNISENKLHISNDTSQTVFLVYYISTSMYRGKYLNYVVSINGIQYFSSLLKVSGTGGSGTSQRFFDNKLELRTYIYNDERTGLTLDIFPNCPDFSIDYFMVYATDTQVTDFLPYYNQDYVNQLYINSSSDLITPNSWYSDITQNTIFDFNSVITSDINLYGDYRKVDFYKEDRTSLLTSYYLKINNNLTTIFTDLKDLYKQELDISYNFDLFFTDDYYSYDSYFNEYYFIKDKYKIYPYFKNIDFTYIDSDDYEFTSSYSKTFFSNVGENLLKDINLNVINFESLYILPLNFEPISVFTLPSSYFDVWQEQYITTFTDSFGNIHNYVTTTSYIQSSDRYRIKSYYTSIVVNKPDKFKLLPYDFNLFYNRSGGFPVRFLQGVINESTPGQKLKLFFNINYNMQFYYTDYFGFGWGFSAIREEPVIDSLFAFDTQNRVYDITTPEHFKLIHSEFLKNSYVNSFELVFSYNQTAVSILNPDEFTFSSLQGFFIYTENPKVFFYNSTENDSSSLIPSTSSGLYKQKNHWYEFNVDIYNFVIYLIFDAPIVSNITKLLYIILAFIVKVIEIIISLFSGTGSTIFVGGFLGFIIFKFILNKLFGGKD